MRKDRLFVDDRDYGAPPHQPRDQERRWSAVAGVGHESGGRGVEGAEGVETSVSATYRVWCLSWEDAEEDGRDVAWYSILDGPPPHSAERTVFSWRVTDAESAVETYADYVHSHRDGWDSVRSGRDDRTGRTGTMAYRARMIWRLT